MNTFSFKCNPVVRTVGESRTTDIDLIIVNPFADFIVVCNAEKTIPFLCGTVQNLSPEVDDVRTCFVDVYS